jgi:glucose-1-phosphate adenylyltransferase
VINDSWIGPGAVVERAIVDENVVIGAGTFLGYGEDSTPNHELPDRLNTGITVVGSNAHIPSGLRIGRNVLIHSDRVESDFPGTEIASGESV